LGAAEEEEEGAEVFICAVLMAGAGAEEGGAEVDARAGEDRTERSAIGCKPSGEAVLDGAAEVEVEEEAE
jgi:hypothetical protein